ncbi:MAG: asparaginase [Bacteroidales bacterium]|nr:asparaginase [Bacteroidales bacterium]
MKGRKASILLIYTGGTIGMKQDPQKGALVPFDFSQILDQVPELAKFAIRIDSVAFDPLIDSSDIEPSMWIRLAELIRDRYDTYDGFVVLHGTDTMAYSASALSFMLKDLTKPVILTGSQLPIGVPRTDGKENLISSVEIASATDSEGRAIVPEVCIFFGSLLLRGNRAVKESSEAFSAFISPNYPPLAEAGINIRYNTSFIRRPADWDSSLKVSTALDTRVAVLKLHPGMTPEIVRHFLLGKETRAVIIETYGSGNAPAKDWFLDIVRESSESGKILVNVTQCLKGGVDMDIYDNGRKLKEAGVVSGLDGTTESTLAKLFVLMGITQDNTIVKNALSQNLRGEILLS